MTLWRRFKIYWCDRFGHPKSSVYESPFTSHNAYCEFCKRQLFLTKQELAEIEERDDSQTFGM